MKLFFDTEFTGLHKNTTLISIGIVDERGRRFYAELVDYDENQVDDWIRENVIDNLWIVNTGLIFGTGQYDPLTTTSRGDTSFVKNALKVWIEEGGYDTVEWVSDVCHYDFVLLVDLLYGHALDIPYLKHSAVCHDINQDIARFFNISQIEAFDKSREEIVTELQKISDFNLITSGKKHNALYDAEVISDIYNLIKLNNN